MVPSGPVRATLLMVSRVRSRKVVVDHDLQGHFPQQRGLVLLSAVNLPAAPLLPEPLGVADRKPGDLDLLQGLADGVEFRRLDDGHNQFHAADSWFARSAW